MIEAKRPAGAEGSGAGGPPPGVRGAGGPPPGVAGAGHAIDPTTSGFEGREELLGQAVAMAIRTLNNTVPYAHEMNDALVKMHLTAIQFAKNQGKLAEFVEHDVKTMAPMLNRMRAAIEKTGDRELALVGMFDRTACHYQLALDTKNEPGRRTFTTPYSVVLEMGRRIGQFDLTEQELHEVWTKPRYHGYAAACGVKIRVSDIAPDRKVTVELVD